MTVWFSSPGRIMTVRVLKEYEVLLIFLKGGKKIQLWTNGYLLYIEILSLFFKVAASGIQAPDRDTSKLIL